MPYKTTTWSVNLPILHQHNKTLVLHFYLTNPTIPQKNNATTIPITIIITFSYHYVSRIIITQYSIVIMPRHKQLQLDYCLFNTIIYSICLMSTKTLYFSCMTGIDKTINKHTYTIHSKLYNTHLLLCILYHLSIYLLIRQKLIFLPYYMDNFRN